jgi:hypothetical protein
VSYYYDAALNDYIYNGYVSMTVPLVNGVFGAVSVKTAGGTSAALSLGLSGITGVALSGTPADAGKASANPGQAVTLNGSGLSTSSDVLLSYVASNGAQQMVLLNPTAAAADGTSATLVVPGYATGAFDLRMLGASGHPTLQVVPTLTGYNVSGTTLQLFGSGLVEGNNTLYQFAGNSITDSSTNSTLDVFFQSGFDSTGVNIAEPVHGLGGVTVTTTGGTSAALTLNELRLGLGLLRDVAIDPSSGALWAADNGSPAKINRIDAATGQVLSSITLTAAFGSTNFFGGLQVVGTGGMTLGATAVPAGSLLLFDGQTNPDRVVAANPTTGAVIATLILTANYDTTGGVYDPTTGHVFLFNRNVGPNRMVEINAATGAEISSFVLPFNAGEAGLAINPVTGNLWYGSDQSTNVIEMSRTGTVLRTLNLALQGVDQGETAGLAFDAAGKLYVASTQGVIYKVDVS